MIVSWAVENNLVYLRWQIPISNLKQYMYNNWPFILQIVSYNVLAMF